MIPRPTWRRCGRLQIMRLVAVLTVLWMVALLMSLMVVRPVFHSDSHSSLPHFDPNLQRLASLRSSEPDTASSRLSAGLQRQEPESRGSPPEEPIRNPHDFRYILNEPAKCQTAPELVVVVCTAVDNWDAREAVRETWGNVSLYLPSRVELVFLVGSTASAETQAKLVRESQTHHDLIQEDFMDTYMNLTLKSVAMVRWVSTFCQQAKYALKSDDDMYINVRNLLSSLREQDAKKFILGHVYTKSRPKRDKHSKWYVSFEQYSEAVYPDYTSGSAYAMTANSAPDLFEASLRLPSYPWEDVFVTGMCASRAAIPRLNDAKFSPQHWEPSGCVFRSVISGHKYNRVEMRKIHSELTSPSLECS